MKIRASVVARNPALKKFVTKFAVLTILAVLIPSASKADEYVSIRKQIQCIFKIQKLNNSNGVDEATRKKLGLPEGISGQINGMQCAIIERGAAGAKDVALSSKEIKNGMIQTKDFGALKMVMEGAGLADLEVEQKHLSDLVAFLQK